VKSNAGNKATIIPFLRGGSKWNNYGNISN